MPDSPLDAEGSSSLVPPVSFCRRAFSKAFFFLLKYSSPSVQFTHLWRWLLSYTDAAVTACSSCVQLVRESQRQESGWKKEEMFRFYVPPSDKMATTNNILRAPAACFSWPWSYFPLPNLCFSQTYIFRLLTIQLQKRSGHHSIFSGSVLPPEGGAPGTAASVVTWEYRVWGWKVERKKKKSKNQKISGSRNF